MTSATDLAALAHCIDVMRRDPKEAQRIDDRLAVEGSDWLEVAKGAAFQCQMAALNLPPWRTPPMFGDVEPHRDPHAAELLRRLLAAGLSRFEASPVQALEQAAKRQPAR